MPEFEGGELFEIVRRSPHDFDEYPKRNGAKIGKEVNKRKRKLGSKVFSDGVHIAHNPLISFATIHPNENLPAGLKSEDQIPQGCLWVFQVMDDSDAEHNIKLISPWGLIDTPVLYTRIPKLLERFLGTLHRTDIIIKSNRFPRAAKKRPV